MYIVVEIQTSVDGNVSTLVNSYDTIEKAENKYHTVLAYAAVSSLPVHTAILLTNEGIVIKSERYKHSTEE